MRHAQAGLVDFEIVVEQKVEIDRSRPPPFAARPTERRFRLVKRTQKASRRPFPVSSKTTAFANHGCSVFPMVPYGTSESGDDVTERSKCRNGALDVALAIAEVAADADVCIMRGHGDA